MKIYEILESYELDKRLTRFTKDELQLIYDTIVNHREEMNISEINHLARELAEEKWHRGVFSAKMALARMHVLVHGVAPHDVSEHTAENWMQPSGPMDEFATEKGINVARNVAKAKRELAGRKARIDFDQAKAMMAAYAKEHKNQITQAVRQNRDHIIADIQAGLTPQEAFARFA